MADDGFRHPRQVDLTRDGLSGTADLRSVKIYTKTGDRGETSLFGGGRVSKDSIRIEAYGTVDELNSLLGVCLSLKPPDEIGLILTSVQSDLFTLGADLATPLPASAHVQRIGPEDIARLEQYIDRIDSSLEPLKSFILPGGSHVAATLHLARTVCRRAERRVVQLASKENLGDHPLVYLNRLSDLLFVLARRINAMDGTPEKKWNP